MNSHCRAAAAASSSSSSAAHAPAWQVQWVWCLAQGHVHVKRGGKAVRSGFDSSRHGILLLLIDVRGSVVLNGRHSAPVPFVTLVPCSRAFLQLLFSAGGGVLCCHRRALLSFSANTMYRTFSSNNMQTS